MVRTTKDLKLKFMFIRKAKAIEANLKVTTRTQVQKSGFRDSSRVT